MEIVGDGGYAQDGRAFQIRKRLHEESAHDEHSLLSIQLDSTTPIFSRWRQLLLSLLTNEATTNHPLRRELRQHVEAWEGGAGVDSVGHRLLRAWRSAVANTIMSRLLAPVFEVDRRFNFRHLNYREGLYRLLMERPPGLADPASGSWDAEPLAVADRVVANHQTPDKPLGEHTWGDHNTLRMQHPFSSLLPMLEPWLDMPHQPLPGDGYSPRAQGPTFGASQRLVVSPGKEENGIFHMPGGQSGHFLSPYYRAGHQAWVNGEPTPFLPGKTERVLMLRP